MRWPGGLDLGNGLGGLGSSSVYLPDTLTMVNCGELIFREIYLKAKNDANTIVVPNSHT